MQSDHDDVTSVHNRSGTTQNPPPPPPPPPPPTHSVHHWRLGFDGDLRHDVKHPIILPKDHASTDATYHRKPTRENPS
jgi:hypothetical protein